MRRRIIGVALASACVALVLFAIPLAVAIQRLSLVDEQGQLERQALSAAISVGPNFVVSDPAELPVGAVGNDIGLYAPSGARVSGTGPVSADSATLAALSGVSGQAQLGGQIVAAVPVSVGERVVGAVRAAAPATVVWRRTMTTWVVMLAAAVLALAMSFLIARFLARRVSRPLDELVRASQSLGDGNFTTRTTLSGMSEIDRAGAALNITAARLEDLVTRERQFSSNASHQLRTPLAGMRATLEAALDGPTRCLTGEVTKALHSADELAQTVDELLNLARRQESAFSPHDLSVVLDGAVQRWHGPLAAAGRPLRANLIAGLPRVTASPTALGHVLDVLIDNALRHGAGAVTVTTRSVDVAVAIDVSDEGNGIDPDLQVFARGQSRDGGAGIGLALARQLAEDQGGRLLLSRRRPSAKFTLLVAAEQSANVSVASVVGVRPPDAAGRV